MLLEQKQFDAALEQFQKAAALEPKDLESHQGIAATLQDMGRLNEAIDEYNRVIALKPDDANAYSNLGNCYGLQGRMNEAIHAFEQAVKLQPQSAARIITASASRSPTKTTGVRRLTNSSKPRS
jgi:tetratricopeptide (TPR) repeat protein